MTAMNRIALLTSNHRRHRWVAAQLASVAQLACVLTEAKPPQNPGSSPSESEEIRAYFAARDDSEARWFRDAPDRFADIAQHARELPWQGANGPGAFELLREIGVERVFLFGSSIIRDPLLAHFGGRIVNMHLGLSPYYRGSATNFWPLVHGLPECVGVTVHHATAVVDGGGILAQARPAIERGDSVHDIGCKTLAAGSGLLQRYAAMAGPLPAGVRQSGEGRLCRRADFGIEPLHQLKSRFRDGMLDDYLRDRPRRDAAYPIVPPQTPPSTD